MKNTNKGISLIALIIIIIVLLILAGITFNILLGDTGIITKAEWSKFTTNYRSIEESEKLIDINKRIEKYGSIKVTARSNEENIETTYAIINQKVTVEKNSTLEKTIKYLYGNDYEAKLYMVDKEKINLSSIKEEYAIDINNGRVYQIKGHKYKGLIWHLPEYGVPGDNGKIEENRGEINIHYLAGYTGEKEYTQCVENGEVLLQKNSFQREGYYFTKWKDVTNDFITNETVEIGEDVETDETEEIENVYYEDEDSIIIEGTDIYLQAQWGQDLITLDANGGTVNGLSTYNYAVMENEEYGELPDAQREGYVFGGWYLEREAINQIVGCDIYNSSNEIKKLYAYWIEENSSDVLEITYNANGGNCTLASKKVVKGKKIGNLPTSKQTKKESYKFDCWTLSDKTTKIKKNYVATENMTIYARYTIHMIFDYQGGNGRKEYKNVKIGGVRGNLYAYAKKGDYKLVGWYTQKEGGGNKIGKNTKITQTEDFIAYAYWADFEYKIEVTDVGTTGWTQNVKQEKGNLDGWKIKYKISSVNEKKATSTVTEKNVTGKKDGTTYYVWAIASKNNINIKSINYIKLRTAHKHTGNQVNGGGCYTNYTICTNDKYYYIVGGTDSKSVDTWDSSHKLGGTRHCIICHRKMVKGEYATVARLGTTPKYPVSVRVICSVCGAEKKGSSRRISFCMFYSLWK